MGPLGEAHARGSCACLFGQLAPAVVLQHAAVVRRHVGTAGDGGAVVAAVGDGLHRRRQGGGMVALARAAVGKGESGNGAQGGGKGQRQQRGLLGSEKLVHGHMLLMVEGWASEGPTPTSKTSPHEHQVCQAAFLNIFRLLPF